MSQKGYDEAFNYLWTHDAVSLLLEDGSIVTGDFFDQVLPEDDDDNHTGYIVLKLADHQLRAFNPDEVAGLAAKQPEG